VIFGPKVWEENLSRDGAPEVSTGGRRHGATAREIFEEGMRS
jgi:hypothetical protein